MGDYSLTIHNLRGDVIRDISGIVDIVRQGSDVPRSEWMIVDAEAVFGFLGDLEEGIKQKRTSQDGAEWPAFVGRDLLHADISRWRLIAKTCRDIADLLDETVGEIEDDDYF